MSHKRTNDESKVAWPFKDEHERGLRSKHVDLPSMRTELTETSLGAESTNSASNSVGSLLNEAKTEGTDTPAKQ